MSELEWLQRTLVTPGLLPAPRLAAWLHGCAPEGSPLKHLVQRGILEPATARTISAVIHGYVRMEPATVLSMFRPTADDMSPGPVETTSVPKDIRATATADLSPRTGEAAPVPKDIHPPEPAPGPKDRRRPATLPPGASSPALRAAVDGALWPTAEAPPWPPAGERLAGHDLQALLRSGPDHALYRARLGDRKVLLKLQRADAAAAQQAAYARLEAARAHPAIVPLLSAGLAAGLGYLVFDDPGGLGLAAHVARSGPLPPDRVLRVGVEAAQALAAAARLGVAHGDLGPERLLVCRSDARVMLFDLAVRPAPGAPPAHRAPEHGPGAPAHPQADMFSLGALLHLAATGHLPAGPGLRAPLPGLPRALSEVLAGLLHPRPERRPGAWDDVVATLLATRTRRDADPPSTDGESAR